MTTLSGPILQAVANPKQFLWAPFEPAICNICLTFIIFILSLATIGMTPLPIITVIAGHAGLIMWGSRNPHLIFTLRCTGKYPPRRRNLSRVRRGVKFVP